MSYHDDEVSPDTQAICDAIRAALHFENASAFEHVFGPCKSDFSVAEALRSIASGLHAVAEAIRERP